MGGLALHPEQIRVGMWIRVEDVRPCSMPMGDGEMFVYSQQLSQAQFALSSFGGLPLRVVAVQFPFVLANTGPRGLLMIDLRFNRIGKCDSKFVDVIKRMRARNAIAMAQLQVEPTQPHSDGSGEEPEEVSQ